MKKKNNITELSCIAPRDIEARSMEIISKIIEEEFGGVTLPPEEAPIVKRVIHTTADFDYLKNLTFSNRAVSILTDAIAGGADIVTDTQMAKAGISKKTLARHGGQVYCFMSDPDVAAAAKERGVTRAIVSMEKAARLPERVIFAIGNAPTALVALHDLMKEKKIDPIGIIAVPVGFVNVIEAKELILTDPVPSIVARGRKGGSNVAAAICNALIYSLGR